MNCSSIRLSSYARELDDRNVDVIEKPLGADGQGDIEVSGEDNQHQPVDDSHDQHERFQPADAEQQQKAENKERQRNVSPDTWREIQKHEGPTEDCNTMYPVTRRDTEVDPFCF